MLGDLAMASEENESDPVSGIWKMEEQVRKINVTEIWKAQLDCFRTGFSLVGACLRDAIQMNVLSSSDGAAIRELLFVMESGLGMIKEFVKDKKAWSVRTLFMQQNLVCLFQQLHECVHLVSIEISSADTRNKVTLLANVCMAELQRLCGRLEDAWGNDKRQVLQWTEEARKGLKWCWQPTEYSDLTKLLLYDGTENQADGLPVELEIDQELLQIRRHIDSGAFGAVYEASFFNHVVAVKVFRKGDASFRGELSTMVNLKHPNIIQVIGYSHDPKTKQYSLVMERMSMDLGSFIEQEVGEDDNEAPVIPLSVGLWILLQIAEGMKFLHTNNVIHRDLKPGNILIGLPDKMVNPLRRPVSVKISDFGTARKNYVTAHLTHSSSRVGTKIYMAPEVYFYEDRTETKYSKKADVYSFAMICYHVLSGKLPFEDISMEDFNEVVYSRNWRPDLPETCPEELATLVQRCWSENSDERPAFSEICEKLKKLRARTVTGSSWWYEVQGSEYFLPRNQVRAFSETEILKATNGFTYRLGYTACRGSLASGEQVAVEVLFPRSSTVEVEMRLLSQLNHPNLVKLLGHCNYRSGVAVSEYLPSSLSEHLGQRLDWMQTLEIAIGIASGVSFLHSLHIVHTNLHSDYIFLDNHFRPKVGGLKFSPVCGLLNSVPQYEFSDPDTNSQLSDKSDVYSFGGLLLWLITGTKPVLRLSRSLRTGEELRSFIPDSSTRLLVDDSRERCLDLALSCLQRIGSRRPTMQEALHTLVSARSM